MHTYTRVSASSMIRPAHLASGYVNGFVQHYPHGRLPAAGMSGRSFVRHVIFDVREHFSDGYVLYRPQRTCGTEKKTERLEGETPEHASAKRYDNEYVYVYIYNICVCGERGYNADQGGGSKKYVK